LRRDSISTRRSFIDNGASMRVATLPSGPPAPFMQPWKLLALQPDSRAKTLMPRPARTRSTIR
jgi:hypothetical protein